jgi:ADP-ribose pyrophosphatase YjhB (NUDIX family)
VRAVVVHGTSILVLSDRDEACHVVPGGRIEPGESWLETVRREVLEETGLTIQVEHQIAVIASTHQLPRTQDYRCPYPTFLQVVYLAISCDPAQLLVQDEWVSRGAFVAIPDIAGHMLPPIQMALVTLIAADPDGAGSCHVTDRNNENDRAAKRCCTVVWIG